uniref:Uncharacterized protein n=2 Tax=Nothobranchius korthausae TaxID=1143690 RepID=A0A1A8F1P4_9TELE
MGNRFGRRRDAPASVAGTVAAEQKTVATPKQTEDPVVTQTQETEDLEVMAPDASSPKEECVRSVGDAESEPTAEEPQVLTFKISDPEDSAQPEVIFEALKPDPVSVLESEPASHPEADAELLSEPTPAEALEQPEDLLNQESVLFSPFIDFLDVASSPTPISASLRPDESSGVSGGEQCEVGRSMLEPEKLPGMTEFLDKPMEAEAAECLEMPVSDVSEENVSEVLKNSELNQSDFLNDIIESEVKIPEDTPITDLSSPIELM